jgi:hypothetical protein
MQVAGIMDVSTGTLRISDPCYDMEAVEGKHAHIVSAKNGLWNWKAEVKKTPYGMRVMNLVVEHATYSGGYTERDHSLKASVDSGQLAIVDGGAYPEIPGTYEDENSWYYRNSQKSMSLQLCGPIENMRDDLHSSGVVSATGMGDGSYEVACEFIRAYGSSTDEDPKNLVDKVWRVEVVYLDERDV